MKHEFSGRCSGNFLGATEHFHGMIRKFVFHFFKANFDNNFKAFTTVFVKEWNCLVQDGKRNSVTKFATPGPSCSKLG